jgi:hypothetical protein
MSKTILSPRQAFAIDAQPNLGVTGNVTKVGFRDFVSYIELAAVIGHDDTFVWVCRDESCDTVDFIDDDEAAQAIANGYQA